MEVFYHVLSWGSPVGLGLFFFLSASGAGVLFWGMSRFNEGNARDKAKRP